MDIPAIAPGLVIQYYGQVFLRSIDSRSGAHCIGLLGDSDVAVVSCAWSEGDLRGKDVVGSCSDVIGFAGEPVPLSAMVLEDELEL